jgi:hypothetical protein
LNIAKGARLDEACFRLAMRTIMHAIDPQTRNIVKATGNVVTYAGATCLLVHHEVLASMKQQSYAVFVCFSAKQLVACRCTCQAGCQGQERVMCVHILPVLYQITLLLFEGLAEHAIIEIANAYKTFANTLSKEQISEITKYILTLKRAAHQYKTTDDLLSIEELLNDFNVGTEKRKYILPPPKDPTAIYVQSKRKQVGLLMEQQRHQIPNHHQPKKIIMITIIC